MYYDIRSVGLFFVGMLLLIFCLSFFSPKLSSFCKHVYLLLSRTRDSLLHHLSNTLVESGAEVFASGRYLSPKLAASRSSSDNASENLVPYLPHRRVHLHRPGQKKGRSHGSRSEGKRVMAIWPFLHRYLINSSTYHQGILNSATDALQFDVNKGFCVLGHVGKGPENLTQSCDDFLHERFPTVGWRVVRPCGKDPDTNVSRTAYIALERVSRTPHMPNRHPIYSRTNQLSTVAHPGALPRRL